MLLRLLFVLLIALNIAVGAWLLLGQNDVHRRFVTDPGVPKLRLLSELPPPSSAAARAASVLPPATAAASPAPVQPASSASSALTPASTTALSYACMALGPFATQEDLRIARNALSTQVQRMRARQEQTTQTRGWWVHLPPSQSHAAALAQARALAARNIQDYFVVGSGDDQNTVSLGLFKDPANARKRRDQIQAAGFPVQMSERTETVPEYWLDLIPTDSNHFDWRSTIHDPSIGSHSTGCF
ncbi:SPOR domain-containing protein [Dyella psychrodurans]|uniref:SPOR domain-containing protein n=1 Tax=Dyella psychrodurans TaxID=1927960 RepID=A0A370X2N7_9GAMM|nr:SPOR domain-containing protein [Dyella psychrodurans]RDS82673.1 SPOR domain-containing protein [Dyella psychrodurans]